jgi:hypothetical protein
VLEWKSSHCQWKILILLSTLDHQPSISAADPFGETIIEAGLQRKTITTT